VQLHHRRPGEELGHRPDAKEGLVRIDGRAPGDIGVAVSLREKERAIPHDRYGDAGDVLVAHVGGHEAVHERLNLDRFARTTHEARGRRGRDAELIPGGGGRRLWASGGREAGAA
jgi:hypothetical protein